MQYIAYLREIFSFMNQSTSDILVLNFSFVTTWFL